MPTKKEPKKPANKIAIKNCKCCRRKLDNCKNKKSRRDHGNSSRNPDKWKVFIDAIRLGSERQRALDYSGIASSTLDDWVKRDSQLSEEYEKAKSDTYMQALQVQRNLLGKDHYNTSADVMKAYDKRYNNKIDVEHSGEVTSKVLVLPALNDQIIDVEDNHLEVNDE